MCCFTKDVSIIIPIYNGEKWIDRCFQSISTQTAFQHGLKIEISVYNDASIDKTDVLLSKWKTIFEENGVKFLINKNEKSTPSGVGYAKNSAVKASTGEFLCFQDIDDQMLPNRLLEQYLAAKTRLDSIIGSQFIREPPNSTVRFTNWANNITQDKLNVQIYTSHGPTVIMPTWFFHRSIFEKVGGFSEEGKGTPEDLIFFYKHIDSGGKIFRVDKCLLIYTYHEEATTFSIPREKIWEIQLEHIERRFLTSCDKFTIWNAGKQGRKFFKGLNEEHRKKVVSLCDVDVKKIGKTYEMFCPDKRKVICTVPIHSFKDASPPFVICMKLDLTDGNFEENLSSLNLKEGTDYILFS